MAQVLDVKNRIIEHPGRYKLTQVSGTSDTYDLEAVTGEVTETGTAFNRNLMNKIDNVLSYLTPSVEVIQQGTTTGEKTYTGNILPVDITPTYSNSAGDTIGTSIVQNCTTFDNITPTITYAPSGFSNFVSQSGSSNSGGINVNSKISGANNFDSSSFLVNSQRTSTDNTSANAFYRYKSATGGITITYDFKTLCKPTFNYYFYADYINNSYIQASKNGTSWVTLETSITGSTSTYTPDEKYRYYRFYFYFASTSTSGDVFMRYCYVSNLIYDGDVPAYCNKFVVGNNQSFVNKQRLLIETPSTTTLNNISTNTIENITCDTLLQASTKYELVYNSTSNKFDIGDMLKKDPIVDVTLTEAVSTIDLCEFNKFEIGKTYLIKFYNTLGGDWTSTEYIQFNRGDNQYVNLSYVNSNCLNILLTRTIYASEYLGLSVMGLDSGNNYISSTFNYTMATGNTMFTIQKATVSNTFTAGTRIIIEEVA